MRDPAVQDTFPCAKACDWHLIGTTRCGLHTLLSESQLQMRTNQSGLFSAPLSKCMSIHPYNVQRLKSSVPFKRDLARQNIPLSKLPFKTQPQIENQDIVT